MKTGKLIISPAHLYQSSTHKKKSYIPVTFSKNAESPGGKLRPEDRDST